MSVTISDIANLTGKNRSTVSRVLRGDVNFPVSDQCRAQILDAARRLNYVPAHSARSLATGKSYCVATLLASAEKDLASPYFAAHLMGMFEVLLKQGYHLTLLPTPTDRPTDDEILEMARARRIDGFYIGTNMVSPKALQELTARKTPVVTTELDPQIARTGLVSVVRRDDKPALRALAHELVRRGHRRIAFVAPDYFVNHPLPLFGEYVPLFRRMLKEAGAELPDEAIITYSPSVPGILSSQAEARVATERHADHLRQFTAIVTNSDLVAFAVAEALRPLGLEPGRDYALVGYNNIEQTPSWPVADPMLTTIEPHYRRRGVKVASLLLERIANPRSKPRVCSIPTELIIRRSMVDAAACQRRTSRAGLSSVNR